MDVPEVIRADQLLRIVILIEYYQPEPAATAPFAEALAGRLVNQGHDVMVVTGMPNYPEGRRYEGYPALRAVREVGRCSEHVLRLPELADHSNSSLRRGLHYFSFVASALAWATRLLAGADVVYVCGSPVTAGLPARLLRALGVGPDYLVHVQDLWPESVASTGFSGDGLRGRVVRTASEQVSRLVYGGAGRVVAISSGCADRLADRPYIDADRVRMIPNWADEGRATLAPTPQAEGPLRLLYAGNVGSAQGLGVLLDAVDLAVQREVPVHLDIVGAGTRLKALRDRAMQRGLDNVVFHGRRPASEMADWYARAELQIVSLRSDPLFDITVPSKIAQLLYHGLPILCVADGNAADVVDAAGAGWTVRAKTPAGIVDALAEAHDHRSGLVDLGRAGRAYYDEHLARSRGLQRLAEELVALADTGDGPVHEPVRPSHHST